MTNAFTLPKPPDWLKQLQKDAGAARGGQARAHAMGGIPMPSLSNGKGAQHMGATLPIPKKKGARRESKPE